MHDMKDRRQRMSGMKAVIFGTVLTLSALFAYGEEEPRTLTFGVVNQQSPARTAERWNPVLRYLSMITGIPMRLKMGSTIQETDAMMGRGEFDLLFTNHNFQHQYDGVYKVIARWAGPPIYGVIAVNTDSAVTSIRQLAGKRVAFPSTAAFVAYAVPMAALRSAGIEIEPVMAGTQEGAMAQLKARQVDAAALNSRSLTLYSAQQNQRFREIYTSEGYADIPVVAHPRLPTTEVSTIRQALLGMRSDPRAAAIMEAGGFPGFQAASDRDYDNVRRVYSKIGE